MFLKGLTWMVVLRGNLWVIIPIFNRDWLSRLPNMVPIAFYKTPWVSYVPILIWNFLRSHPSNIQHKNPSTKGMHQPTKFYLFREIATPNPHLNSYTPFPLPPIGLDVQCFLHRLKRPIQDPKYVPMG